jgi:hypothetical protein
MENGSAAKTAKPVVLGWWALGTGALAVLLACASTMIASVISGNGIDFGTVWNAEVAATSEYRVLQVTYMALGVLAVFIAIASEIRGEPNKVARIAFAMGVVAFAFKYFLIGLLIAGVIFFLANMT